MQILVGRRMIALACFVLALSGLSIAQQKATTVLHPIGHDKSKSLREMPVIPPAWENMAEHPVKPLPKRSSGGKDTALQTQPLAITAAAVSGVTGFNGVGLSGGYTISSEPPDTNGSVGATQYVQWVNTAFAIYDKATGNKIYPSSGYAGGNTIWQGFTAGNCSKNNDGDPIVMYDKINHRWIFTQFSVSNKPYSQCVAISQGEDARGPYYRYAYSFGRNFNDYPKVGVWTDGYYFTFNLFANAARYAGAAMCAMDNNISTIAAGTAKMLCFQTSTAFGGLLPADIDGSTLPPTGTREYVMGFGNNVLQVWRLLPNYSAGTMSVTGPTNISVASFSEGCGGGACISQPSTTQKLDSLADRLMYRLPYRKFASYGSILVNHTVTAGSATGVRWYELRDSGSGPTLAQQGTYAPDSAYRWMGSIAQDKQGNIAAGYSVSSSSVRPSIRFATRAPSDAAGQLSGEQTLQVGTGSQSGHTRWGDYASLSVDPVDDCTLWFTTEYLDTSGDFIWSTHIDHFKLGTCQ
jgi:hypothetical protein